MTIEANGWHITVSKRDLVDAVGTARTRATLRRKSALTVESEIVLTGSQHGLSVRSSDVAMDIDGIGTWPSPISTNGPHLRRLAPQLNGPEIVLRYESGQLFLNSTAISAREV